MGLDTPGTEAGDPEEWRRMIDLNIMALLYTARAALPELRKTKGHLVLTGSMAGKVPAGVDLRGQQVVRAGLRGQHGAGNARVGRALHPDRAGHGRHALFRGTQARQAETRGYAEAVLFALTQPERASVSEVAVMPRN